MVWLLTCQTDVIAEAKSARLHTLDRLRLGSQQREQIDYQPKLDPNVT